MKVINPDYVEPETPETVEEAEMSAKEVDLREWFSNHTDKSQISFKRIRGIFGKTEEQWPDGLIHQKLEKWGFEVVHT